jgi:hypothetical protein
MFTTAAVAKSCWSETTTPGHRRRRWRQYHHPDPHLRHRHQAWEMQQYQKLSPEPSQLVEQTFSLFELSREYEFQYESTDCLVSRIKEVYSSTRHHPPLDVNARSKEGDTLLRLCVSSFHLEEEDPDAQLDLVRFLLDKGADPNLEDALGETALDWLLDQSASYHDYERSLTRHQVAMVRLLVDRGGRVYRTDRQGRRFGLRDCNIAVHPRTTTTTLRSFSWNAGHLVRAPPRSSSSCT